jgi:general transcription factor 3C polypeptide 5 (transcription factor C subunit 1)
MRQTIQILQSLYEKQPAWTRRGLRNNLTTDEHRTNLRHAIPYIGYIFRSGPWRDAIIKLGVDPRTSPDYRHYQTFMFRLLAREAEVARDGAGGRRGTIPRPYDMRAVDKEESFPVSEGHKFTGHLPFSQDGRIWMIGDITDPQLRADLYPENPEPGFLRETCEIHTDGWFGNGTIAKAKTIMRSKIQAMMDGREPDEADYVRILQFPAHAASETDFSTIFTLDVDTASSKEISLATEVRSAIRSSPIWRELTANVSLENERQKDKKKKEKKKGKGKTVGFEVDERDQDQAQSEGEEEEIERQELLAAQVVAAAAARDADEEDAANGNGDGDDSDRMDEDEDE